MANLLNALNERISRVARKHIRSDTGSTRRLAVQHRRDIAALKRQVQDLTRRLAFVEAQAKRTITQQKPSAELAEGARFSPRSVKAQRNRLGLSAEKFGKLLGVTGLTVYSWEAGKFRPRREQLARLVAVRRMGKREANRRLEMLGEE
jgi:DNA-binding transcriptional regulator YiaG